MKGEGDEGGEGGRGERVKEEVGCGDAPTFKETIAIRRKRV